LVARAKAGDLDAFDRLLARHRARLFGIARQITGDLEAAQDVVQEALARAFRSLDALRDGARFGQWLNTIVRRQALAWVRDGDRRPETLGEAALWGVPSATWDTGPDAPSDVVERIRESLDVLTQRERRVMVLHYLEGFTCEEIAAKLGVSPGGVKRILHTSRRKVRKECEAMAEAEKEQRGPRRLKVWIDGSVPPGRWDVFDHLQPGLAQAVCLAVNKEARTAEEIAARVEAHVEYVREVVSDLAEMTVFTSPKRGKHLASFIAFDAEDWRRLMQLVPEPAAEVAERFAGAEGRLRAAFEKTPLAACGWEWDDVIWVMYAVIVANAGVSRCEGVGHLRPTPDRPGGGSYWLGAHEDVPGLPSIWTTGLNSSFSSAAVHTGHFWTWQIERGKVPAAASETDRAAIFELLVGGPRAESEIVELAEGRAEEMRSALADLVKLKIARRRNGKYELGIPLFGKGESDVLTAEVDAVVKPAVADIIVPALRDVDSLLDEMGYGHWREQYPEWHCWLGHNIPGEALRYLMEQGVLPRPREPVAPDFVTLAWERGIDLMW
jgi:RNA polymerase sigma-70 factor (ECF subfamily)